MKHIFCCPPIHVWPAIYLKPVSNTAFLVESFTSQMMLSSIGIEFRTLLGTLLHLHNLISYLVQKWKHIWIKQHWNCESQKFEIFFLLFFSSKYKKNGYFIPNPNVWSGYMRVQRLISHRLLVNISYVASTNDEQAWKSPNNIGTRVVTSIKNEQTILFLPKIYSNIIQNSNTSIMDHGLWTIVFINLSLQNIKSNSYSIPYSLSLSLSLSLSIHLSNFFCFYILYIFYAFISSSSQCKKINS